MKILCPFIGVFFVNFAFLFYELWQYYDVYNLLSLLVIRYVFFTKPKHERHTWACFPPPWTLSTYSTPEGQSSFLPMILNVPLCRHHLDCPTLPSLRHFKWCLSHVTGSVWRPRGPRLWSRVTELSKTSLNCGQVNWFHPSRLTFNVRLLQHGCFPHRCGRAEQCHSLLISVYISTFLKREASKWEGLLSYFFPSICF